VLLCGSLASAQTIGRPVPAQGASLPAVYTSDRGELSPIQPVAASSDTGGMQRVRYQPRPPNQPLPEEGIDIDFESELPSQDRVLGRLESERGWQERLKQREKDKGKPAPVFPEYAMLTKEKYYGRQWPQQAEHPEPNCVWYGRLYFEQKNFDRYGWDLGPISPIVDALVFGADVALLPYHMGTDPFRCYEWNTGYCLPGDPTPLLLYPPGLSLIGATAEMGSIFTLIAAFP
jgi:hypothetical protein